jgi:hypothetical protein
MGVLRATLVLAAAAALAAPASAVAEKLPVQLSIAGGALSVKSRDGSAAAGTDAVRLRLIDARGTGAGWTLRLAARTGRLVVTGVRVACAAGSTCTLPKTALSYPLTLDAARPLAVLDAGSRTGMGAIDVTLTVANASGKPLGLAFSLAGRSTS